MGTRESCTRVPAVALDQRHYFCTHDASVSVRQIHPTLWHVSAMGNPQRLRALDQLPVPGVLHSQSALQYVFTCASAAHARCLAVYVLECISDQGASACAQFHLERALSTPTTAPLKPTVSHRL